MKNQIIIGVVALGLFAGCATNEDRDDGTMVHESAGATTEPTLGTTYNELPSAVRQAIRQHAPNAKVDDIDKEMRTGRAVYEITFAEPGKNPKLHIAADGSLVKNDQRINGAEATVSPSVGTQFSELPAAVQKAVKSHAPNAKIDDIDKEMRTGRAVYEITFQQPGDNPKLHGAEDGTIVSAE